MRYLLHISRGAIGLIFIISASVVGAQNVLNGGFENVSAYPNSPGELELAAHWTNIGTALGSPDLFHVLGTAAGDLPETPIAIVNAFQGMAIAGFSPYTLLDTGKRQYISGSFDGPLTPGVRYQMTLHMTNGEVTAFSDAGLGIAGLGMRFSEGPLQQTDEDVIDLSPHFVFSQVFYDREWRQISFNFIAQESWTHFAWGLFGNAAANVTIESGDSPKKVYCFVDGFSLVPVGASGSDDGDPVRGPHNKPNVSDVDLNSDPVWFVPSAFTPNGDGDNDTFKPVWGNVYVESFEVYSRWGQRIYLGSGEEASWDGNTLEGEPVESGSYVWKLTVVDDSGKLTSKSGSLFLIR